MRGLIIGAFAASGGAAVPFVPNDFVFTDQTDVAPGTVITSAGVQVTASVSGSPCAISVSGGEYQTADDSGFTVNASAWSSTPGLIAENQYVRARHTSSSSFSAGASCTVTIGEPGQTQDDTFNSTTRAAIDVFLTSTPGPGAWTPPGGAPTWGNTSNVVEVLGSGGNGAPGHVNPSPFARAGGAGGGGGGYARQSNITIPGPGAFSATVAVGGDQGSTFFDAPTTVRATSGTNAVNVTVGTGGTGTAGATLTTGGSGGSSPTSPTSGNAGGGGGGGAAGFGGNGGNGAAGTRALAPATGPGGGGGGSAGSTGAGGSGSGATGGTAGTGGGAAGGNANSGAGNAGSAFGSSNGSGSGGGGAVSAPNGGTTAGAGGNYGGGGGGGGGQSAGATAGGAGAPGIIHIQY